MSEHPYIVEVTDQNFEQTVLAASHQTPVVVDFWAEWCGPCKQLFPILTKLVDEYAGKFIIGKVNIDEQSALAAEAGVRSVPMVLVFRKGVVTDQFLGLQPESVIREMIERNLFRESDQLVEQAREAYGKGDLDAALSLARQALDADPERYELRFECLDILLAAKAFEEAEALLRDLPRELRENPETEAQLSRIELEKIAEQAPPTETLLARLESDPENLETRHQLAARYAANNEYEAALEQLLTILRKNRAFGDDAGRRGMIAIFSRLGSDSPLVHRYRKQMFNALH
ncbi:MAG: thioredoxin [Gammaproteobacteria bacterium]